MKGYRKIMKAVAVILAFALIFSGMNVPGTALAATTAATAKNTVVKSITVSNCQPAHLRSRRESHLLLRQMWRRKS